MLLSKFFEIGWLLYPQAQFPWENRFKTLFDFDSYFWIPEKKKRYFSDNLCGNCNKKYFLEIFELMSNLLKFTNNNISDFLVKIGAWCR